MKNLILFVFTCSVLTVTAQIPNYVPSNGLVGWWPFNGNANDESGNGNNGTVNGATLTTDRNGLANAAYSFDGVDDRIFIDNNFFDNSTSYSISGWYFLNSAGNLNNGNNSHIILNTSPHNGLAIDMNWGGSNLYSIFVGSGAPSVSWNILFNSASIQNIEIQNWKFIVLVKNLNDYYLFINGVLDQSWTVNNPMESYLYKLYFGGCDPAVSNEVINGKLDDIGIWNRVLTDCEIQNLYQAQLGFTTLNAGADQEVCNGTEVILNGTGGSNLMWNNGVVNGVSFVPTQTSNYLLTGADSLGCVGVDTVMVMVNAPTTSSQTQVALDTYTWPVNNQTYTQSGVYTDTLVNAAGCDSILTLNLSIEYTGLDEQNQVNVLVSPNPITNDFSISGIEQIVSLSLKDVSGKLIKTFDVQEKNYSISNLTSGVYFLEVSDEKRTYMIKVMKK